MRISFMPLLLQKRLQLNEELRRLTLHDVIGRHFVSRRRDTKVGISRRTDGLPTASGPSGTIRTADLLADDTDFSPRHEATARETSGKQFLQQILSCLITNTCKDRSGTVHNEERHMSPSQTPGTTNSVDAGGQAHQQSTHHGHHQLHRQQQQLLPHQPEEMLSSDDITNRKILLQQLHDAHHDNDDDDDEQSRLLKTPTLSSHHHHQVDGNTLKEIISAEVNHFVHKSGSDEDEEDAVIEPPPSSPFQTEYALKSSPRHDAIVMVGHRQSCHRHEAEMTRCLNDGQCFVVEFHNGARRAGCSCQPNWAGLRCEQRYVDPNQWGLERSEEVKIASVGNSSALLVVALFLVWFILHSFTRYRRGHKTSPVSSKYVVVDTAGNIKQTIADSLPASDDVMAISNPSMFALEEPLYARNKGDELKVSKCSSPTAFVVVMSTQLEQQLMTPTLSESDMVSYARLRKTISQREDTGSTSSRFDVIWLANNHANFDNGSMRGFRQLFPTTGESTLWSC